MTDDNSGIIEGVLAIIRENFFLVVGLGLGAFAAIDLGYIDPNLSMPDGSGVIAAGAIAAAFGGYIAAGKIADLLPEPEGIYLIAFEADDEQGGEVWELSEDQFADLEVQNGTLFQWPSSKRIYEAREYDPDRNVAIGNWRESVAGSELAGNATVPDAFAAVEELRQEFEPESRKYRHLQRRIRSIVRKADRRRLRDQQALLDDTLTPEFANDDASISSVLRDELPDELLPDSMKGEAAEQIERKAAERNGHDDGELVGFDLLEDGEALEPQDNEPR